MATRFAKTLAGISAFIYETKRVSTKGDGRKPCGLALSHGKITALWFREVRGCPRALAGAAKQGIPLCS
ncbi:MAG: hypothetical protein H6Q42_4394 [Deltaproteobacteria bacterium]|nr:hypothetical protein [Deltaproteobacteria bacterium]